MARAYFKTACGHQGEVTGFNRRDAESRARWMENRGDVYCSECREKRDAEENAASIAWAVENGLPPIRGSEKSATWAETIRRTIVDVVDDALIILDASADLANDMDDTEWRREVLGRVGDTLTESRLDRATERAFELWRAAGGRRDEVDLFVSALLREDRASWWTDARFQLTDFERLYRLAKDAMDKARKELTESVTVPPSVVEEMAGAVIRPAGEPISPMIAEVAFDGRTLFAKLAAKHDDFHPVVRALGYDWDAKRRSWTRELSPTMGGAKDRLAETAHRLAAAGFVVSVRDEDARAAALDGSFTPEVTRWIVMSEATVGGGSRCRIMWGRREDYYDAANSLPGARYRDKRLLVPIAAAEAIEEFAEWFDFSIAPDVRAAFAAHREVMARGAVVGKITAPPVRVRGDLPDRPPALAIPDELEIDAELRE